MRRCSLPVLLAAAVAAAGFLVGPASSDAASSAAASYGVSPSHVMLNPQPLPPRHSTSWSSLTSRATR